MLVKLTALKLSQQPQKKTEERQAHQIKRKRILVHTYIHTLFNKRSVGEFERYFLLLLLILSCVFGLYHIAAQVNNEPTKRVFSKFGLNRTRTHDN